MIYVNKLVLPIELYLDWIYVILVNLYHQLTYILFDTCSN